MTDRPRRRGSCKPAGVRTLVRAALAATHACQRASFLSSNVTQINYQPATGWIIKEIAMSDKSIKKPLTLALGTAFVLGTASSVFAATELPQGYEAGSVDRMELLAGGHERKDDKDKKDHGEGKCGEGKCGESMAQQLLAGGHGGGDKKDKDGEGKCGEGKCGSGDKGGEGSCGAA